MKSAKVSGGFQEGKNGGCGERTLNRLDNIAGKWGGWVSRWPNVTRLLAFVIFLGTAPGLMNFDFETEEQILYCPEDSIELNVWKRWDNNDWDLSYFDRSHFEIAMHANGDNVLTSHGIAAWNNFTYKVNLEYGMDTYSMYEPMRMEYYFRDHFYDYEVKLPTPEREFYFPWQTNDSWRPAIWYEAPLTYTMIGKPRDSSGNSILLNNGGLVDSAEALRASWRWVDEPLDMVETCAIIAEDMDEDFKFSWFSNEGIGHELLMSFLNDAPKFGATIILLIVICVCFLWRSDLTRNKTMVILTGFVSSLMAVISSFGFGMGIGSPKSVNQIVGFMPFLILAIGMDDLFVIIRSYELTSPKLSAEQRIAATMYDGGISVTITSLTDFVAFLGGGLMVKMPAVRDLCWFVAYGIFFLYFYCVTLVLSVLVCQARREEEGSANCCSCRYCGSTEGLIVKDSEGIPKKLSEIYLSSHSVESMARIGVLPPHFAQFLQSNVSKLWWRIAVFSFSIGYLVIMTMGAVNLFNKVGLDYKILAPKGSYLAEWYDVRDRFLDEASGHIVNLVVDDEDCDYADEDIKDALVSVYHSMNEVECILGELGSSWIDRIEICMEIGCEESCRNTNWTTCYEWFQNYGTLSYGDYRWWRGMFFDDMNTIPKATQMLLRLRAAEIISFDRVECLEGIYSRLHDAPCNMMAFNHFFPFYAGDKTAVSGTWQTMIFAMLSCLGLCLIFIPNIWVVLTIVFCIGFLLIGILGCTYYLDYRLDSVSQVLFLMGIGFAVDFAVHVSHSFLHAKGNRAERVGEAIRAVGEAVFLAAITTILGVALLFTSSSVILVFLASLLSIIMVIGLSIAGILLPTMLACIGPENIQDNDKGSQSADMEMTTGRISEY